MPETRVAMIGLGLMGSGMARRLLAAGFPLSVYNRALEKSAALASEGAYAAKSPFEAAARADVVVSMVADDTASRAVWLGSKGALAGANPGSVLVESSTVTVGWIEELARDAAARGLELLDAPVTGSKPQAASGELTFLVGGNASALEAARPALAAMSKSILHVGGTGRGALLKLVNNFMCGVQAAALGEAMALIEGSGLDRDKALQLLTAGAPGSPLVKTLAGRMTARDYSPNFVLRLMAKDLGYAYTEGRRHGVPLATVAAALQVLERAVADGHGDDDFSALVEPLRNGAARANEEPRGAEKR